MNNDIENRLKELRLQSPDQELEGKILSSARKAWDEDKKSPVRIIQFRQMMAIAASLILFAGILALLNISEERKMQQVMLPYNGNSHQKFEKILFIEEMGLGKEYSKLIASIPSEQKKTLNIQMLNRELKL